MKTLITIITCIFCISLNAQFILTPKGVQVPSNALFTYNFSNSQLQSFQSNATSIGPSVQVLLPSSNNYNCHGYAWNVSTGGNEIGIDDPTFQGVAPYVSGSLPSYTQVTTNTSQVLLRVRYTGDHSAVRAINNNFVSKWGAGPRVLHNANDVPAGYGSPSTFWTCIYSPPLQSVLIDNVSQSNTSVMGVTWGSHSFKLNVGLDPDRGPIFSSTATSTTISGSNTANPLNFGFNNSQNGGLSVNYCGATRYSFIFFKKMNLEAPNNNRNFFDVAEKTSFGNNNLLNNKMDVFPNPSEGSVTLEFSRDALEGEFHLMNVDSETAKLTTVHLYNIEGKLIQDYTPLINNANNTIRFNTDLKGVYFLKATFSDNSSETKKIIFKP